jgi:hypothetical protein
MSSLRDFLDAPTPRRGTVRRERGGLLDLVLVIAVCLAVIGRTPAGALVWWVGQRVQGTPRPLPSLTATFQHGMLAPPTTPLAPPPPDEVLGPDQLPEPYRSALRSALSDGVPDRLAEQLGDDGGVAEAMERVDALYDGDPDAAVEALVIGHAMRQRAIERAIAAGAESPDDYEVHRVYLPQADRVQADRVVAGTLAVARVLALQWPVAPSFGVTSPFGVRIHPTLKTRKFHNGIDLGTPVGTPVMAPQSGTVTAASTNAVSGNYLIIDHGHGVQTSYCHLSQHVAKAGERVTAGQLVAKTGNTGRSTGPHLHYIVRIGGDPVDPLRFGGRPGQQ